jgi:putative transposase
MPAASEVLFCVISRTRISITHDYDRVDNRGYTGPRIRRKHQDLTVFTGRRSTRPIDRSGTSGQAHRNAYPHTLGRKRSQSYTTQTLRRSRPVSSPFCHTACCQTSTPFSFDCWDNPPTECSFSSLKHKWLTGNVYPTREAAVADVRAFTGYCSSRRLHTTLGNLTPIEFEQSA